MIIDKIDCANYLLFKMMEEWHYWKGPNMVHLWKSFKWSEVLLYEQAVKTQETAEQKKFVSLQQRKAGSTVVTSTGFEVGLPK